MSEIRKQRRKNNKLRTAYFSVVISVTLVLFVVGCIGLSLIMARQVTDYLKEQFTVVVFFKKEASLEEINSFVDVFKERQEVRLVKYISKEQAAKSYASVLGEDFLNTIGENPLLSSVELSLKADFVRPDLVTEFTDKIGQLKVVDDVLFPKDELRMVYRNTQRVGFWFLVVSSFFLFIAIILINNTIRLGIYAKRFTIKTMQLVGATRAFIRKPFLVQGFFIGLVSGLLSCVFLGAMVYWFYLNYPIEGCHRNIIYLAFLGIGLIMLGILISCFCTYFATQRFLKLRTGDLYD